MNQRPKSCEHRMNERNAVRIQGYVGSPCPVCYDRGLFSDLYKDENGSRPDLSYWSDLSIARWLRRRTTATQS